MQEPSVKLHLFACDWTREGSLPRRISHVVLRWVLQKKRAPVQRNTKVGFLRHGAQLHQVINGELVVENLVVLVLVRSGSQWRVVPSPFVPPEICA